MVLDSDDNTHLSNMDMDFLKNYYIHTNINISRYELGPIGQGDKVKDRCFASFYNDASMMIFSSFYHCSNLIPLCAVSENPMRDTGETARLSSHRSALTLPHISTSAPWQILLNLLGSEGVSLVKNQIRVGATAQLE